MIGKWRRIINIFKKETEHQESNSIVLGDDLNKKAFLLEGDARTYHLQIIGADGTGKSLLSRKLATQDILAGNNPVIFLEPNNESTRILYDLARDAGKNVHYIEFDEQSSVVINPLGFEDVRYVKDLNLDVFINYLGRRRIYELNFHERKQLNALDMAISIVKNTKGEHATYIDIWELLNPDNQEEREVMLAQLGNEGHRSSLALSIDDLEEYNHEFKNEDNYKRSLSIYEDLFKYIKLLTSRDARLTEILCGNNGKSTINMLDFLKSKEVLLISTGYGSLDSKVHEVFNELIYNLITSAIAHKNHINTIEERMKTTKLAFYIDEWERFLNSSNVVLYQRGDKFKVMFTVTLGNYNKLDEVLTTNEQSAIHYHFHSKVLLTQVDEDKAEHILNIINDSHGTPNSITSKDIVNLKHGEAFVVTKGLALLVTPGNKIPKKIKLF